MANLEATHSSICSIMREITLTFNIYSFFIQTKTRPPLREGAFDLIVPDGLQGADANGAARGNDAGKQAHHHGKADGSQHQPDRNDGHDGSAAGIRHVHSTAVIHRIAAAHQGAEVDGGVDAQLHQQGVQAVYDHRHVVHAKADDVA